MSGGSLDYFYSTLEEHVGDFADKELDELVFDLSKLFHDREWYLSADTCEGSRNEAGDSFKAKWFKNGARQERIEKYVSEFAEEMRKSFGLSHMYCKYCKHWKPNDKGVYGDCQFMDGRMMHRCESCDKWERKTELKEK